MVFKLLQIGSLTNVLKALQIHYKIPQEYHKCILIFLTTTVGCPIMNLVSETHYNMRGESEYL